MACLTAAAAAVLRGGRQAAVVVWVAAGLLWGWPVAALAAAPYAVYVLTTAPLARATAWAAAAAAGLLGPLVVADRVFYGRWTVSKGGFGGRGEWVGRERPGRAGPRAYRRRRSARTRSPTARSPPAPPCSHPPTPDPARLHVPCSARSGIF